MTETEKTNYCSSCMKYQNASTGSDVFNKYGKKVRWRCYDCHLRATHRTDELCEYTGLNAQDMTQQAI